ncbi:MAG TPA: 16S rRNA (cytidine(1402)-2'-O)-methyltransferase [Pyrinomonadaceae bacterium]|jgi:16S rRNA (cytidine1402-2'-O)-methyltransferase|nr:16S rRNA (cytidine(1402)-2'-O)-methyltransferase [Pyrinomonadaceae bacterium]
MTGTLYLVATPIGNLEDITLRALRVLREADLVACEDTRHTQGLLNHFGLKKRTVSYHEHNEEERGAELLTQLAAGARIALVSDAGTPAISDPGYRLVRACHERGVRVVPVPGPTALVSALIASGLPTDEFFFGGFLPARPLARRRRLQEVRRLPGTLIFYETPHRLAAALADAREILGDREAVVARELTKMHEEIGRGRLGDLAARYGTQGDESTVRGEIVLLIDRASAEQAEGEEKMAELSVAARVALYAAEGLDHKAALKRAAREMGLPRDEAYRRLIAERALE